jgi:molybdate transport system substrate-binding protein
VTKAKNSDIEEIMIQGETMRGFAAAATIGLFMLFVQPAAAEAAEVKVLHTGGFTSVMNELGLEFGRATGHKLVTKIDSAAVFKRQIDAGETFDVAILTTSLIAELVRTGKIAATANIARSGIGVGVRTGAPKPDISSVEAFKRTLLRAKSVAHSEEGASGVHFKQLLERLGIAADMKAKLKPLGSRATGQAVAKGEVEIFIVVIPSIVASSGVTFVGPVPAELQTYIDFTAGVSAAATQPDAAKALIKHLTEPAAVAVIKAKGFEPVAPQ